MLLEKTIVQCLIIILSSFSNAHGDYNSDSVHNGEPNLEYINDIDDYQEPQFEYNGVGDDYEEPLFEYNRDGGRNSDRTHPVGNRYVGNNHSGWLVPFNNARSNGDKLYKGKIGPFNKQKGTNRTFKKLPTKSKTRIQNFQKPLILTPFIKRNSLLEGIRAAKVGPLLAKIISYSGFFEVNEKYKSYMFFWYFRSQKRFKRTEMHEAPVIVWLQGGMGHSSLFSALRVNGPIHLEQNGSLSYNKYSWAKNAHLVYFDNPVGAGFSFTKKGGYSKNNREVVENLYEALKQFLTLFHLAENPLYLSGQSYAGKYITGLGVKIDREKDKFYINFHGAAIGNGFIDPPNMLRYGAYLYQLGFIDKKQRNIFQDLNKKVRNLLKNGKNEEARDVYAEWIAGNLRGKSPPLIEKIMGSRTKLNYMQVGRDANEKALLSHFLKQKHVQKALNTGGIPFTSSNVRCKQALWPDLLKSEVENLQKLLDKYSVLLYNGQMSVKNAYPLMISYVQKMKWSGAGKYKATFRGVWKVDGEVAGYFKKGSSLEELLVRNAGQNVPADQPKWAQRMIENFIYKRSLNARS